MFVAGTREPGSAFVRTMPRVSKIPLMMLMISKMPPSYANQTDKCNRSILGMLAPPPVHRVCADWQQTIYISDRKTHSEVNLEIGLMVAFHRRMICSRREREREVW